MFFFYNDLDITYKVLTIAVQFKNAKVFFKYKKNNQSKQIYDIKMTKLFLVMYDEFIISQTLFVTTN